MFCVSSGRALLIKRTELFVGAEDETPSVAAVCVGGAAQHLLSRFFLRLLNNDCGKLHYLRRCIFRVLIQDQFKGQFYRSDL